MISKISFYQAYPRTFLLVLTLFLVPQVASAEPPATTTQSGSSGKVIEFKQLQLQGTVQRPSAAYLMQRRKLKFKGLVPKKSFVSEIKKSVTRAPF